MINSFPIWLVAIDYILALFMVILILKFVLNLFINEGSNLSFFQFFTKITFPILKVTSRVTPNFIVQPLSFLSGVFYTIDRLPIFFQSISHINPFFHIINIFRYGFLGVSDGDLFFGMIYLPLLSLIGWCIAFVLYNKGYKIKS